MLNNVFFSDISAGPTSLGVAILETGRNSDNFFYTLMGIID